MKICHITSAHNTDDVRIFKKECVSLAENENYRVFLVGRGNSRIEKKVHVIGVESKKKSRLYRMLKFAPEVVKQGKVLNADIYHLHDPELLRIALRLKKNGAKVIFDSHENILESIEEKEYLPIFARKLFKYYYSILQKIVLPKIDAIVVVTPQMIDSYIRFNKNVYVVQNFPIIDNRKIVKENTDNKKKKLVFAGGISEQWSHAEIIKALNELNDIEYRMFGIANTEYLEKLKKIPGWENVYFGGKISYEEAQKEIASANVVMALLKPGRNTFFNEGTLGNTKIFEAMANEKPIIATNFRLWKDIIHENNCGICSDPNDVDQIKDAIKEMFEKSSRQREEMGQNGKNAIKKHYSWQVAKRELLKMYDELTM